MLIFQKKLSLRFLPCAAIFFTVCLCLQSCRQRSKAISFYYWRTVFVLDSVEKQTLQNNAVKWVYTRYFDIDMPPGQQEPSAVAPITINSDSVATGIIPVVYIKNRVFEHLAAAKINELVKKTLGLINEINHSARLPAAEIQFDCDWTQTTREAYFLFLQTCKTISGQKISATIRLHQVKYAARTGVPPVDYGVLMYYNMGEIGAGTTNSIYDKSIAARYISSLTNYPLVLDLALPIFAWSLQLREHKVIKLLNKMDFLHFENDSNFTRHNINWYTSNHSGFHGGYYFEAGDEIKSEYTPEKDLLDIVTQVNRYSNHHIRNIIFYDLDKENLALYDKDIFGKILDGID